MTRSKDGPGQFLTIGIAVLVTAIWGFNFIVIETGIEGIPPLFLAALRFFFSALPAVFFVKRPTAPMGLVAAYGLLLGVGEFGLLFTALKFGAPPGLSSIILQAQAFFTALFAAMFLKEGFRWNNALGMALAALGLIFVGMESNSSGAAIIALGPLLMLILAAAMWAGANVVARKMPGTGALGLMVWSSLFSPIPLLLLSLLFEGPRAIAASHFNAASVLSLAYLVILSTLVGYGLWNHLIMKQGAARIAPFSLLVPIFGVSAAALFAHEKFTKTHALAGGLVLLGLVVHVFGGRIFSRRTTSASAEEDKSS